MHSFLEIEISEKLEVFYQATYKDLECDSADMYEDARKRVPEVVQQEVDRINCVSLGICRVEKVDIIDCSKRQKRSITTTTAGINVSLSCEPALCKLKSKNRKIIKGLLYLTFIHY